MQDICKLCIHQPELDGYINLFISIQSEYIHLHKYIFYTLNTFKSYN